VLVELLQGGIRTPENAAKDNNAAKGGSLSREDFTFDKERNVYICPAGKLLNTTG
jgi:hypothetical protein